MSHGLSSWNDSLALVFCVMTVWKRTSQLFHRRSLCLHLSISQLDSGYMHVLFMLPRTIVSCVFRYIHTRYLGRIYFHSEFSVSFQSCVSIAPGEGLSAFDKGDYIYLLSGPEACIPGPRKADKLIPKKEFQGLVSVLTAF